MDFVDDIAQLIAQTNATENDIPPHLFPSLGLGLHRNSDSGSDSKNNRNSGEGSIKLKPGQAAGEAPNHLLRSAIKHARKTPQTNISIQKTLYLAATSFLVDTRMPELNPSILMNDIPLILDAAMPFLDKKPTESDSPARKQLYFDATVVSAGMNFLMRQFNQAVNYVTHNIIPYKHFLTDTRLSAIYSFRSGMYAIWGKLTEALDDLYSAISLNPTCCRTRGYIIIMDYRRGLYEKVIMENQILKALNEEGNHNHISACYMAALAVIQRKNPVRTYGGSTKVKPDADADWSLAEEWYQRGMMLEKKYGQPGCTSRQEFEQALKYVKPKNYKKYDMKRCTHCGKLGSESLINVNCGKCNNVVYCGAECKAASNTLHKTACLVTID